MTAVVHHAIAQSTILALVIALLAAALVGYVLQTVGVPPPVGWLVAVLVFLVLFFA